MFSENAFSVIRLILRSAFVIAALVSFAFPQTAVREKPKVKDFGKSLIKKKKSKPEDKKTADEISSGEEVIKVETNLVRSDVLVLDQKGRFILGLNKGDFIVTEKNVPQVVETFSLGDSAEIPRSIVLIIDYSGSQKPYIKTSVEAAKNLVDKLNPRDRMAIVTDDVKLLADFTNDKEFLKKKLDSLKNKNGYGKSLQYSALMATLNELFDAEDIRPMIIFQTDGDQSSFIARDEQSDKQLSAYYGADFTVEAMFNSIYKSRATIYSVVSGFSLLGLTPDEQLEKAASFTPFKKNRSQAVKIYAERIYNDQKSMSIVARASGGFTSNLEVPEQADAIYSKILAEINSRYLIGYYPENLERDGKRRDVKIEVRGHPEYIVWGRKTYFAPVK